jgi:hypothetical protein
MAKELPYFKFEPAEYLTKDVSFCSLAAQGLFINLCSYYWQRNCNLTKDQFLKRLNFENELDELITEGAIDLINNDIYINFLDVQFEEVKVKSKTNKVNGSKGGRPSLDENITTIFGETIPREPGENDHFLYLFKRTSNNTYKIGETQDLFKRRNTMKISSKDLSIIHFVKIDRASSLDTERDLKNQFLQYNIGGDWFDFKGIDIQLVITAINEAKKPNNKPIESESKGIREDKIREDKIITTDSIENRKLKFAHSLNPFIDEFGKDMIRKFYDYWTESGDKDRKFKLEKQKSWNTKLRLNNWRERENNYSSQLNTKKQNNEQLNEITTAVRNFDPTI